MADHEEEVCVCFRADGGGGTGFGHIVRSQALAQALSATAGDLRTPEESVESPEPATAQSPRPHLALPGLLSRRVRTQWAIRSVEDSLPSENDNADKLAASAGLSVDPRLAGMIGREVSVSNGDLVLPPAVGESKPPLLEEDDDTGRSDAEIEDRHEIRAIADWVTKCRARFLIIDHYPLSPGALRLLRKRIHETWTVAFGSSKIPPLVALMEDHQARLGADIRLGPWAVHQGEREPPTPVLRGPSYHLIRPEFTRQDALAPDDPNRKGWVMCFGGTDFKHMSKRLLEKLLQSPGFSDFAQPLTLIASDVQAEEQGLDDFALRWPAQFERRKWVDAAGMAEIFATCKLALTSCSGVGCEAVAMRAPCILVNWVENQSTLASAFIEIGIKVVESAEEAANAIRASAAGNAREGTLDVFGALRVAGHLWGVELVLPVSAAPLSVRRATFADVLTFRGFAELVDEGVSSDVSLYSWFSRQIFSASCLLVIEKKGEPVAIGLHNSIDLRYLIIKEESSKDVVALVRDRWPSATPV